MTNIRSLLLCLKPWNCFASIVINPTQKNHNEFFDGASNLPILILINLIEVQVHLVHV